MTDMALTQMTQEQLNDLIEKRVARVRKEYEDAGQDSWRAHARTWENRTKAAQAALKEAEADRDAWKARAKFNLAQVQLLEKLNDRLIGRLDRGTA